MSVSISTQNGTVTELSEDELKTFGLQLRGDLITPSDQRYNEARKVWNGAIDRKPALIVRCAGTADVMAAVNFSREHRLLVSIRGGGHNVAGAAIAENGLVIDLSGMRSVQVDPDRRIARVEGGARLGDLDHETQAFGLAAPVGVVSATGVAGLTLHGGAGWLLRKHGLSIDNLNAVEVVTADGQLKRASADENPDLFWALRGGGGNFGVATVFEFRLHPVGPRVWVALAMYPLERAREVLGACRDYLAGAPEELMVLGVYWSAPRVPEVPEKFHGAPVVVLLGCYTGPLNKGEEVIAPLRRFGSPIADLSGPKSWVETQKQLDEDYPDGAGYYWKSLYIDHLDDAAIEALAGHTAARPSAISSIDVWFMGGAMNRVGPTDTAFFKRDARYMLGIEANWEKPEEAAANIAWARKVHSDLKRFTSGGEYLNFPGFLEDRPAMLEGAYGSNLARLQAIKAKYDPENRFKGSLNIPPRAD